MSLFDVFPWNVASGPAFLAGYVVSAALVLGALRVMVKQILRRSPEPRAKGATAYRSAATRAWSYEDAWRAAELRGGAVAVREAMLGALVTAGGLRNDADGRLSPSAEPLADPTLEALRRRLSGKRGRTAADALALARESTHERRAVLESEGMFAAPAQRSKARWLSLGVVSALVLVGAVRLARGTALHHPVGLLFAALLVVVCVGMAITFVEPRTEAAEARLASLGEETLPHAFRARTGQASPLDAGMTAAVFGLSTMSAAPAYAAVLLTLAPPVGVTIDGGTSSGSCGGSSCGGGGCGSGCGG